MKKKKSRPFLCKRCRANVIEAFLIIFAIIGILFIGISFMERSGYYINTVSCRSNSMFPNLFCNCVFLAERNPSKFMINVGDIILWQNGRDSNVIHRVIEICKSSDGNNIIGFKTKGDNNTKDDGFCIAENSIVGKVINYWCP